MVLLLSRLTVLKYKYMIKDIYCCNNEKCTIIPLTVVHTYLKYIVMKELLVLKEKSFSSAVKVGSSIDSIKVLVKCL